MRLVPLGVPVTPLESPGAHHPEGVLKEHQRAPICNLINLNHLACVQYIDPFNSRFTLTLVNNRYLIRPSIMSPNLFYCMTYFEAYFRMKNIIIDELHKYV